MARGWESKSIESQQADREQSKPQGPVPTVEKDSREAERRTLALARARAASDLARATAPAYRQMLEAAIAALDEQLHALEQAASRS